MAIPAEHEAIEMDPNPKQKDSRFPERAKVLRSFQLLQRDAIQLHDTVFQFIWQVIILTVETSSFASILINGLWLAKDFYDEEFIWAISLWGICAVVCTLSKFMSDRVLYPRQGCCKKLLRMLKNLLLPIKPYRYLQAFHYRVKKINILGRNIYNGQQLSREQCSSLVGINKQELIDSGYDLCESFIQSIPMALLQNYFLFSSHATFRLCDIRDVSRLVMVAFNLVSAARSVGNYFWRQQAYLSALEVEDYLQHGTKATITTRQDSWSHFLNTLGHFFCIASHFYMISFFIAIHWGLGLFSIFLLFSFELLQNTWFPELRSTAENLPVGVPLRLSELVDRWINVFTPKDTRLHLFTRTRISKCVSFRCPLVFVQVFKFSLTVLLLIATIDFIGSSSMKRTMFKSVLVSNHTELVEFDPTCPDPEPDSWTHNIGIFRHLSDFLASAQRTLDGSFGSYSDFYNMIHLHWLLCYIHFVAVLVYNYYISVFGLTVDYFPLHFTCNFLPPLFRKIFDGSNLNRRAKQGKMRTLLFVLSISRKKFYKTYDAFQQECNGKSDALQLEWWNNEISKTLIKDSRQNNGRNASTDWTNSPFSRDLMKARDLVELDAQGSSADLFEFCVRNIDRVLTQEMTSERIKKTLKIFKIRIYEACIRG